MSKHPFIGRYYCGRMAINDRPVPYIYRVEPADNAMSVDQFAATMWADCAPDGISTLVHCRELTREIPETEARKVIALFKQAFELGHAASLHGADCQGRASALDAEISQHCKHWPLFPLGISEADKTPEAGACPE